MSALGAALWDSYRNLVGEVQQVTELVGAGLAVAIRLNNDVISSLFRFSSRVVHLLLLLLIKTREMVSVLKSDLLEFLSDVGSGVHLCATALANLGAVVTSANFQPVLKYAAISALIIFALVFTFVLCNYTGVLQFLATTVNYFLVGCSWTLRAGQRLAVTLTRVTAAAVEDFIRCATILINIASRVSLILLEKFVDHLLDLIFLTLLLPSLLYEYLVFRFGVCAYTQNRTRNFLRSSGRLFFRFLVISRLNQFIQVLYRRLEALFTIMFAFLWRIFSTLRVRRQIPAVPLHVNERNNNPQLPPPLPQVNYINLECQINSDAVNMDVSRLDAYLVARLNMDRHNDMVYHYIVQKNDAGSLYVTVKPLVRKYSFFRTRLNRAREILGITTQVNPLVSKVTWNINHNFRTGQNYRFDTPYRRARTSGGSSSMEDDIQMPECIVCQDRRRSVLIMPCRHLCLCTVCCSAIKHSNKLCPVCRQRIVAVHEVFI